MNIDKTIIYTLLILFFIIVIPAAFFLRKLPPTELLPSEKVFLNFSSAPVLVIPDNKQQPVFSGMDCPVKAPPKLVEVSIKSLPAPVMKPVPALTALPRVSMIYYEDEATKRAIIGGQILETGSTFDHYKVLKIESTRVQIRSAGKDIWLNMQ